MIKSIIRELSNFIFPNLCFSCHSELEEADESYICKNCESFLEFLTMEERYYYHQKYLRNYYQDSYVLCRFDTSSQEYLHLLKYRHGKQLGIFMGSLIAKVFSEEIRSLGIEGIIPCPLYKSKQYERDYNQSAYLSYGFGNTLDIPVLEKLIKRNRRTRSQTKLNKVERLTNLDNAFSISSSIINYQSLIILDDVVTTGATLNEIAKSMKSLNHGLKLYAVAFASPV